METPKLDEAFVKAQGKFRTPTLNRTAKVKNREGQLLYETHYADLQEIIDCIRAPLFENGLAFKQYPERSEKEWLLCLEVKHTSGEKDKTYLPLNTQQAPQQFGATLTYLKRYQLGSYMGLAAEYDDDANATASPQNRVSFEDKKKPEQKPKEEKKPFQPTIPNAAKPKTDADVVAEKTEAEIAAAEQKNFALKSLKELATSRGIANEDMIKVIKKVTLNRCSDSKSMSVLEIERVMRYINNEDQNGNAVNASTVFQNGAGGSYEAPGLPSEAVMQ